MSHEYKTHLVKPSGRTFCGKIPRNWTPLMFALKPGEMTCAGCKKSYDATVMKAATNNAALFRDTFRYRKD